MRYLKAFFKFLYDFFVGDTPELFVAGLAILGSGALVHHLSSSNTALAIILPALVALAVAGSVLRERARRK